jgi:hypothetical protein
MTMEFRCGHKRVIKDLNKFGIRTGIEAFGDVCHKGHGSSSGLISKAEVSGELLIPSKSIDHFG